MYGPGKLGAMREDIANSPEEENVEIDMLIGSCAPAIVRVRLEEGWKIIEKEESTWEHGVGPFLPLSCQQEIDVKVRCKTTRLRVMFDAQVKESRITPEAAKRAGLEGEKCQERYVETLSGGMTTVDEVFRVPLEDRQGKKVMLHAIGTSCIAYSHGYELPKDITSFFPGMSTSERDYKMAAGVIYLVISSDYASWLPRHI